MNRATMRASALFTKLMSERGLTVEQLAAELGFVPSFIDHVRSGRTSIGPEVIERLCSYAGVPPAYFFEP